MPKYDYRCPCGEEEEFEFSIHDDIPTDIIHLACIGNGFYKRVYQSAATHFKGQGWGKTYRVHKPKGD